MSASIKTLRKFVDSIPWAKVYKKAENVTRGQRLYPSRSLDQTPNFRIDKGAKINNNHYELPHDSGKCVIDPKNEETQKVKEALEESFKANN
ncbi:hypothetical protein BDV23DRAFT_175449 [Aspergillus alliaceus]|uniref:Uncharacterized protein n=1 Tax=Petromyces alliaceus TaxID=209559 RepID=A0A5N7BXB1_PETAA|nr:hypothetical protein BDV23DRAFT_175449 [Aspergillus alliaceus]